MVETALHEEHHRTRLDNSSFEACEVAYLAALERRRGQTASAPRVPETEPEPTGNQTLTPELAALRVSDARNDDLVLLRLAETLDLSPGRVRAALERAHHRQRLDRVDFTPSGPTQELLIAPSAATAVAAHNETPSSYTPAKS